MYYILKKQTKMVRKNFFAKPYNKIFYNLQSLEKKIVQFERVRDSYYLGSFNKNYH